MQTWIYVLIAAVGFLMGLMFKVPFVIACSLLLTGTITTVAVAGGWPLLSTFGTIAAALFALQSSYLLGVTAFSVCHRRRTKE